jgi:1,4-dihydroxy-2-naphthoate octaprenyltransferase
LNGLLLGAALLTAADFGIMVFLAALRGWPIVWFAVTGLVLSVFYTLLLKRIALGELTALVVWGPLMTVGTVFAVSGVLDWRVILASVPYGLIVAGVLVGKHMDKIDADRAAGIRTIPVVMGSGGAAVALKIQALLFYAVLALLVVLRITGPWVAVTLLAVPRLVQAWRRWGSPKPNEAPDGWTVWPLWYVGWAMLFNRRAGAFLILALILDLIMPLIFPGLG